MTTNPSSTEDPTPDLDRIDDAVLALLSLTLMEEDMGPYVVARAWKGHDWDALDRLYQKGFIDNPKGKAKSIILTEEGWDRSEDLFEELFCKKPEPEKPSKPRHRFTRTAAERWDQIPKRAQEGILRHVWCTHCSTSRAMDDDFIGMLEEGDLLIRGFCAECGHIVVRLVEPPD